MSSSIIEVGIGLVLVYMVLSLLVSQINNVIKNALNTRADLYRAELERLLQDSTIREQVMNHPAINFANRAASDHSVKESRPGKADPGPDRRVGRVERGARFAGKSDQQPDGQPDARIGQERRVAHQIG